MSDLASFQRDFVEALDGARRAHPFLAIYRNTIAKGAIEALADNYPTVAAILGPEAFFALARDFVTEHPPESPVLAAYGLRFCEWLEARPIARELIYLSGVAQIDRFRIESHLAADDAVLDPAELAEIPAECWSNHSVTLHPATRFGWFTMPAPSIWFAHLDAPSGEIAPDWRSEGILVTRRQGAASAQRIGAAAHRILFGLRIGETIGSAVVAAACLYPDTDITDAIREILASGALSALDAKGRRPC